MPAKTHQSHVFSIASSSKIRKVQNTKLEEEENLCAMCMCMRHGTSHYTFFVKYNLLNDVRTSTAPTRASGSLYFLFYIPYFVGHSALMCIQITNDYFQTFCMMQEQYNTIAKINRFSWAFEHAFGLHCRLYLHTLGKGRVSWNKISKQNSTSQTTIYADL